jgi:hypothetical protein
MDRLLSVFGKKKIKPTAEDVKRLDFNTSTQRMGLRFNEKMRNIFRLRWVKKH